MSKSKRLTIRMPERSVEVLARMAAAGGFKSASELMRCVAIQFIEWKERQRPKPDYAEWSEGLTADYLDPAQRKNINERL